MRLRGAYECAMFKAQFSPLNNSYNKVYVSQKKEPIQGFKISLGQAFWPGIR
jgi:hypothetical protein